MDFEILINDLFVNLGVGKELAPIANKRVLSLLNDFEAGVRRQMTQVVDLLEATS